MKKITILLMSGAALIYGCQSSEKGNGGEAGDTLATEEPFNPAGISQTLLTQNGNRTRPLKEFEKLFESRAAGAGTRRLGINWIHEDSIEFSLRASNGDCQVNCWQLAKKQNADAVSSEYIATTPEFTVRLRINTERTTAQVHIESDEDEYGCVSASAIDFTSGL